MGYGKNLKEALDRSNTTVKELSRQTGIAATTLYSIIQRDASVRYDFALRISNVLDIPINSICKENPYDQEESYPGLLNEYGGVATNFNKKTYFSNRTMAIMKKFGYNDLPKVDQLIADFFLLDDEGRKITFDFLQMMKKDHTDPEREKKLSEIKK